VSFIARPFVESPVLVENLTLVENLALVENSGFVEDPAVVENSAVQSRPDMCRRSLAWQDARALTVDRA
jgi:hypothetical protein